MSKLIKNRQIVEDKWIHAEDCEAFESLPDGNIIVSVAMWQQHRNKLLSRAGKVGVLLTPDEEPASIADDLKEIPLIAVSFPKFLDGRGYSSARELRTYYGFRGEVRAVGDVLRDQLFQMERCGFNSFEVREDRSIEDALTAFNDFSTTYQADCKNSQPLYRR